FFARTSAPISPRFPCTTLFRSGEVGAQQPVETRDADALPGQDPSELDTGGDRHYAEHRPGERIPPSDDQHGEGQERVVEIEERRSEEHTSELQSRENVVCRLLL